MISVIIPTYNAYDYIIDCIDSIVNQTYFTGNNDYEILVGIDGYHDTVDVLRDLIDEYPMLRVLILDENEGTYVVLNTLLKQAKGDIIIRFNADDIMVEDMIEKGMEQMGGYDIVRFGNFSYLKDPRKIISTNYHPRDDTMMFRKKKIIKLAGGYQAWRREGDRDLVTRLGSDVKIKDIETPLYYRRLHQDSQFYNSTHGFHTEYGRFCRSKIGHCKEKVIPQTCGFKEGIENWDVVEKEPISIVIAAHKAQGYIQECLDSIKGQTYFEGNDDYEILIGVDGCQETLDKVQKIRGNYNSVRVFMNKGNQGVYSTINSLMSEAKNDVILRFDADDIMKPNMVKRGMYYVKDNDIVQFGYNIFYKDINDFDTQKFRCADGVVFLRKWLFEKAGGFRPWTCAADSEFISRVKRSVRIKRTRARLFYRRLHNESLTREITTSYTSKKRKQYKDRIRVYKEGEDYTIDMVKSEYEEI